MVDAQADWQRLIEIVHGPWPDHKSRFVHRDFQHYNVLWSRGRPTCLLDWINASMGPVELDFSHFRHNRWGTSASRSPRGSSCTTGR